MDNIVYSDMAIEFCKSERTYNNGVISYYEVDVDEKLSKRLKRPCGKYSTLETSVVLNGNSCEYGRVSDAISRTLSDYCKAYKKILCVGLGNPDLTADALGDRVFKKLNVFCDDGNGCGLYALTPNVFGMTGIESYDIIASVVDRILPDAVLAVDSLTAAAPSRLATAFQITDSGITPGSGVDNHRKSLNYHSLGVPVVSIGVPLVVYASTIVKECCGLDERVPNLVVTPKDVDVLVEGCATVIAGGINGAFAKKTCS